MPRLQTGATERRHQKDQLKREVASELGVDNVTITVAEEYRRRTHSVTDIVERELDLTDVELKPIGVVLAQVTDFKIIRGVTAVLNLATNAREFGPTILNASMLSHGDLLVCALYSIPRKLGLDPEDPEAALSDGDEDA